MNAQTLVFLIFLAIPTKDCQKTPKPAWHDLLLNGSLEVLAKAKIQQQQQATTRNHHPTMAILLPKRTKSQHGCLQVAAQLQQLQQMLLAIVSQQLAKWLLPLLLPEVEGHANQMHSVAATILREGDVF